MSIFNILLICLKFSIVEVWKSIWYKDQIPENIQEDFYNTLTTTAMSYVNTTKDGKLELEINHLIVYAKKFNFKSKL